MSRTVSKEDLLYQLNSLDPTKATQKSDIPTNIMKKNYDIFSELLFENFNNIILTSLFPEQLKYADVKSTCKKDSRNDKRNYRPVSILSNISKIYERLLYKQLETYFESSYNNDLEQGSDALLKWFTDNLLKANPEKYHLLVSTNEKRHLNVARLK